MKTRLITALAISAAVALTPSMALAQRQPAPTAEQRLDRLERQLQQMQRQVFPKGRPADTAGYSDDPAATQSSVVTLDQRLDAVEKQMADLIRQSEENGNHLRTLESGLGQLKSDEEQRISALEQKVSEAAAVAPVQALQATVPGTAAGAPPKPKPAKTAATKTSAATPSISGPDTATAVPAIDEGEDAYSAGFRLWQAGQYDEAIAALKSFTAAYPKHRRVSYANNLIGRSLIEKGQLREAAAVLLANYRSNTSGERAADSLYYLGQAEMRLGQPSQACKAYEELDSIYGAKVRPDLKKQVSDAKAQAQCS